MQTRHSRFREFLLPATFAVIWGGFAILFRLFG